MGAFSFSEGLASVAPSSSYTGSAIADPHGQTGSHLDPFRRGPHDVPTLPTYHLLKKSPWPRVPGEWKFVGVVEHGRR